MEIDELACPITNKRFMPGTDNPPNTLIYGYLRIDEDGDADYYYAPGFDQFDDCGAINIMANEHGQDWEDAQSLGLVIKTLYVDYDPEGNTPAFPGECFLGLFCDQPEKLFAWFNDRYPPGDHA